MRDACPPRVPVADEFDTILSGFLDVLHQVKYVKGSRARELLKTVFCIEIVALSLARLASPQRLKSFQDIIRNPVLGYIGIALIHYGTNNNNKYKPMVERASKRLIDEFQRSMVGDVYVVVRNLYEGAHLIFDLKRIRMITAVGFSSGLVLHCEIKLHLYSLQEHLFSKRLQFHIGKALCSNCTVYFYYKVVRNKRPKLSGMKQKCVFGSLCRLFIWCTLRPN